MFLLNLLKFPFYVLRWAHVAYRSRYRGREAWEVFRVLVALGLKTSLRRQPRDGVYRQWLFGFDVQGSSYELLLRLFKELFLTEPYAFAAPTAPVAPRILDAGANIGMAVLYFKRQFPAAHIVAFEPNPEAFRLLARNVAANQLHDVVLHHAALAATAGELPFYYGSDGASLTGSLHPHASGIRTVQVPARRLSEVLADTAAFDLLKLDVEGAEVDILAELAQTGHLGHFRQYLIEYHYPVGTPESTRLTTTLQAFEQQGFAWCVRLALPPLPDSQDIIFHCWQLPEASRA
ncbi:FkbM family methyltransferase [Hymenobacter lapidiphilus]|uniref:FkbM family methyltransferase n=1 Tax=Hymenobacter lapidiphilus TaxID=2608003 RepID=A0A7Y7PNN9_9BACT|nr:FkbM family methyltransferase [Hymenobacter lapidiphilus]NVO31176.1 FkbM family methyltransferase [Hymenobacter lapidiphilus]